MADCGGEIKSIYIHTLMLEHGPNIGEWVWHGWCSVDITSLWVIVLSVISSHSF